MTMTMENQTQACTHRGLGIVSFIIGVTSVSLVMGLVEAGRVMSRAGTLTTEFTIIVGLGIILALFLDVVGFGLGIFGAIDRSSKEVYPVLGLLLNAVIPILVGMMVVIGLSAGGH